MEITGEDIKVDVVTRKLIKPCTPTPAHLRTLEISLIEEINPSMNVFRIIYYPSHPAINGGGESVMNSSTGWLEESLAKALPLLYPMAGRYVKERRIVDCNDQGALYLDARVNCTLLQFMSAADVGTDHVNYLLPLVIGEADEPEDPMLAVQISRFRCGGLAIGLCVSHRVSDASSVSTVLKVWANAATNGGLDIRPVFNSSLYFPSENVIPLPYGVTRTVDASLVTKRFVFNKDAISILRGRMGTKWNGERPPSRVVVVSALLTQAVLRADRAKHHAAGDKTRSPSPILFLGTAVNVRERTVPPISKYACGAWYSMSYAESNADETSALQHDYPSMVLKVYQVIVQGNRDCEKILSDREFGRWAMAHSEVQADHRAHSCPDVRSIQFADWSKFGDYELDFGFGRPVWVSAARGLEDIFVLMNKRANDGLEAWVCLHESNMSYFEQDEDLRMLTTKNQCRV